MASRHPNHGMGGQRVRQGGQGDSPGAMADSRHASYGLVRIFFAVLAIAALVFTWRGVIACTNSFLHGDYVTGALMLLAAAAWVAGVIGMVHNGRRMRIVSICAWLANVAGPLGAYAFANVGVDEVSPWYGAGSSYAYLPLVGACAALIWLAWSSPARVASRGG